MRAFNQTGDVRHDEGAIVVAGRLNHPEVGLDGQRRCLEVVRPVGLRPAEVTTVDHNAADEVADLFLMSRCPHAIVANSWQQTPAGYTFNEAAGRAVW